MKHQHYDCIVAWAEGKQIEYSLDGNIWHIVLHPEWGNRTMYRIKPEPKPDIYKYIDVRAVRDGICQWTTCLPDEANLGLVFDGETRKLKSAEVLK
jgi:hypothetical protein